MNVEAAVDDAACTPEESRIEAGRKAARTRAQHTGESPHAMGATLALPHDHLLNGRLLHDCAALAAAPAKHAAGEAAAGSPSCLAPGPQ